MTEHEGIPLAPGHGWRAQPHCKVLVLDRGAVRLEYPESWVMVPTPDCVKVHDRQPPDDDCTLGVSYHRWPAAGNGLSVARLVEESRRTDPRALRALTPIVTESRLDMELAWGEGLFEDATAHREACGRLCLARRAGIQALLTFDFWTADRSRCEDVWGTVIGSLWLAEWIADPRKGPSLS
jgi:hypothetical protein